MLGSWRCPRCNRTVPPADEAYAGGQWYIIYECPECLEYFESAGELYEAALAFAVASTGEVIRLDEVA